MVCLKVKHPFHTSALTPPPSGFYLAEVVTSKGGSGFHEPVGFTATASGGEGSEAGTRGSPAAGAAGSTTGSDTWGGSPGRQD